MKTFKKLRKRFLSGALALLLAVQLLAPYAYADEVNPSAEQLEEVAEDDIDEKEVSEETNFEENDEEISQTEDDETLVEEEISDEEDSEEASEDSEDIEDESEEGELEEEDSDEEILDIADPVEVDSLQRTASFKEAKWIPITSDNQTVDSIIFRDVSVDAKYTNRSYDNDDIYYSCAAFVKRFYANVFHIDVYNLSSTTSIPMANEGKFLQTSTPVVGDIIRDNWGIHWAIVKEVHDGYVVVIQQNYKWVNGGILHGGKEAKLYLPDAGYSFWHWSGYSASQEPAPSFELNCTTPTGNRKKGETFTISGYAQSDSKLSMITTEVYQGHGISGELQKAAEKRTCMPGNKLQFSHSVLGINDYYYSWGANSEIDDAMKFASLSAGEYTFAIYAYDKSGKVKCIFSEFSVYEQQNVVNNVKPSITLTNEKDTLSDTAATRTAVIKNPAGALISECGMILYDQYGTELSRVIEKTNARNSTFTAWYATNNSTNHNLNIELVPGTNYTFEMYAYVGGERIATQGSFKTPGSPKPETPTLSVDRTEYASDDVLTLNWNAVKYAKDGYSVTLYKKDGSYSKTIDTTFTTANFVLEEGGTYSASIIAKGYYYSDTGELNKDIIVHGESKVTFVEEYEDGSQRIIKEEMVKYQRDAHAPQALSRTGWIFQGWDISYLRVEHDIVVKAIFTRCKYTVTFQAWDNDRNYYDIKKVMVDYEGAAEAPVASEVNVPEGYKFTGWDSNDYQHVTSNKVIQATYVYENYNLPITLSNVSCEFDADGTGYYVRYSMQNATSIPKISRDDRGYTNGRAVVMMKTSDGRLVKTTESNAFSLKEGGSRSNVEVFVPYESGDIDAAKAEIVIVSSYSKDIPLSKSQTVNVVRTWSGWSPVKPEGVEYESRIEYRYQDLVKKTSSSPSMQGYNYVSTTESWGAYGSWSGWSRTPVYQSESREVLTNPVVDVPAYTKQHYYFYYYQRNGGTPAFSYSNRQADGWSGINWIEFHDVWLGTPGNAIPGDNHVMYDNGLDDNHARFICSPNIWHSPEYWYTDYQYQTVPAVTHTEYQYRDRQKVYTYHFERLEPWSDWSTTKYTAINTSTQIRTVEQRTVYRYKSNVVGAPPTGGYQKTITGKVDTSLAGKQILLVVYKYNEPSDSNTEYLGQTTVGTDGSYSFTFTTREDLTEETGDFTIKIGIEGASELMYVDTLEAPKPEYSVKFIDWDGTTINEQTVLEGDTATAPANPIREGYRFIGWNTGLSNVHDDLNVEAIYERETCTVIFVDKSKDSYSCEEFGKGSEIVFPSWSDIEGYDFIGWFDESGNEVTIVDRNMVVTAQYKIKEYTVTFHGFDNDEVLSEQTVTYGQTAYPPEPQEIEGLRFTSWSTYGYSSVKSDLDIYPSYNFYETTSNPVADIKSKTLDAPIRVTLSCPDPDAYIYYTLDGTTPDADSTEYTEPITIDRNVVVQFFARSANKNDSEVMSEAYLLVAAEDDGGALVIKKNELNIVMDEDSNPKITYVLIHEDDSMGVEFHSLNDAIASVDNEGNVTANGVGSTQIFAVTKDYRYADYIDVNVTSNEIKVDKLDITDKEVEMFIGEECDLETQVYPLNATYQDITWSSADDSVVRVNQEGHLMAAAPGKAYVSAYSHSGNNIAYCFVSVEDTTLTLSDQNVVVGLGSVYQLNASIRGIAQEVTFKSDDSKVVTVDNTGLLHAVGLGTATILVTASNGDFRTCTVRVTGGQTSAEPPAAPTVDEVTDTSITLIPQQGCEYSIDGKNWQDSNVFVGLTQTTEYIVYSRVKATEDTIASSASKGTIVYTLETTIQVADIAPQTFTGAQIKPEVVVTYKGERLTENVDYKLSFKNNINASETDPIAIIAGKGIYEGTIQKHFVINPKNIEDSDVFATDMTAAYNGKVQKLSPTVTAGTKKLANGKDIIISYPDTFGGAYCDAGDYTVKAKGNKNYTGELDLQIHITNAILMSKMSVASISAIEYDGNVHNPEVKVSNKGKVLVKGTDYELAYPDTQSGAYVLPGTYKVNVVGKGDYAGIKTVNFKITGVSLKKPVITGWVEEFTYSGNACEQDDASISLASGTVLTEGVDYVITYTNNVKAGKANAVISGINGYSGSVKKTFKINAYNILNDEESKVAFASDLDVVEYAKGGACPSYEISFDGEVLTLGKDYTVSYANNKAVTDSSTKKIPTATITGKGNFAGKIVKEFDIIEQDISNLTIIADDVLYKNKAGFHQIKPVVTDVDGKKLSAGSDYDKVFTYTYADGSVIGSTEIPEPGSELMVTVTGCGNYYGELSAVYRVGAVMISKAKVTKLKKMFTGDAIELRKGELVVTYAGITLVEGRDFEIVEGSYTKNVNPGTATCIIRGLGDYAGTAKVSFTISKKKFL